MKQKTEKKERIYKTKDCFFGKINKIGSPLVKFIQTKDRRQKV